MVVSTYEEVVQNSTVTYTVSRCADPECQKIVDKALKVEEQKRIYIKEEQVRREIIRKKLQDEKKKKTKQI